MLARPEVIDTARDALRSLLLSLQRHMDAADLLPVLDHEREFLASIIEAKGETE